MEKKYAKKDLLLERGKEEFLKYGYEKASLRDICGKAGVTTGALYFLFKNKADLFDTIVRDIAIEAQNIVDIQVQEMDYRSLAEFLNHNRDELMLLCLKSQGTKYEGFMNRIEEISRQQIYNDLIEDCGEDVDPDYAYLIARMMIANFNGLISKERSVEEIAAILKNVYRYKDAGYRALVESIQNKA